MNWIKLLYPHPHFEMQGWPLWIQKIHGKAMIVAYYIAQTLALLGLAIIYLALIVPLKILSSLRGQDLLNLKIETQRQSYLLKSDPIQKIDFKRMY
ncbi:MAG TPA: hypothetical protein VF412_14840 [Bdellovibrio sp.]|uniref:hypothetical protein n=1 Tax=Bdellovibrio sp. TaxID=28201 RepID=UPI002F0F02C1